MTNTPRRGRPPVSSYAQRELDKAEENFEKFDENIKQMTLDRMNEAPKQEQEPQTKLSSNEIQKSKDLYLKPDRTLESREKFNEKFRSDYEFSKEYVHFIAENKEIIGETIDLWTKPYPGLPAEFWKVPTNKPVWAPRYVAEQIKKASYHRFIMQDHIPSNLESAGGFGQMYGAIAVDTTVQRLDAHPVSERKSVFMGGGF